MSGWVEVRWLPRSIHRPELGYVWITWAEIEQMDWDEKARDDGARRPFFGRPYRDTQRGSY